MSVGACTSYESAYEKAVYDAEPVYCYQSLAGADCYRTADRRDDRRLINYYGPAPSKYAPPKPPPTHPLRAPPKVDAGADAGVYALDDADPVVDGAGVDADPVVADADPAASNSSRSRESDWRTWLPLLSVAFGALQVVAAFVM